ncbi:putative oxidoreductase [Lepidopterella palustris CBS 459.81]|uniref:Putative oxidoreductase n=1 Tax=Lepidopterella palustris CBS 459.81 TaxID=1314670 RepID=A0A8E2JHN0_9PEZI|nr:putative oxidoreductase [Lepidopterella palustris CBS 459.81]
MSSVNGNEAGIPVIDISSPSPDVAKEILHAVAKYGFVFVKNHEVGIPPEDIQGMFDLSRDFFSSPSEVKAECSIHSSKSGKNRGWLSMHTETLDPAHQKRGDFKEAFNIGEFVNGKADQPLPGPLAAEESRIANFANQCHNLCNKLLHLFASALEIPSTEGGEDWFSLRHDRTKGPSGSVLRLLYYPSIPNPPDLNDIRAGAHSDYGSLTLLFQLPSQPGLEILTHDSTWAPVPVNPSPSTLATPPILVNIGDLLSYWTNGLLKSTVHRVIFPKPEPGVESQDRYSIAYFCHPLDEARLVPVPSKVVEGLRSVEGEGQKIKVGYGGGAGGVDEVLTAKDHLNRRLAATYGLKEEEPAAA